VILAGRAAEDGHVRLHEARVPAVPRRHAAFTPALMTLAVISIVYGACLALVQTDIKKIIAYSSISHLVT